MYRIAIRGGGGHGALRCFNYFSYNYIHVCSVAVNKIPPCGVVVISKPTVCDVCTFHATEEQTHLSPPLKCCTSIISLYKFTSSLMVVGGLRR